MANWWEQAPKAKQDWWKSAPMAKRQVSLEEGAAKAQGDITDVGKGITRGLVRGTAESIAAPKELGTMLGQGVGYGLDRLAGLTPEQAAGRREAVTATVNKIENESLIPSPLTLIQRGYEAISPYLPTPTTAVGKSAENVAAFIPSAVVAPGMPVAGNLAKASPAALAALQKGVPAALAVPEKAVSVAPAIATAVGAGAGSEVAGKLTEGTSAEPYARVGGMLLGGRIAGGRINPVTEAASKAPTLEAITAEKNALYKALDDMNVRYDSRDFMKTLGDINSNMGQGLSAISPKASAFIADMKKMKPSDITWQTIDALRKNANKLPYDERAAKMAIINALDDFIANAGIVTAKGGKMMPTTEQVAGMTQRARELASRTLKADELQGRIAAGETGYVSGPESGIGRQFASKAKKLAQTGGRGYSDLEQEAIAAAAQGSLPQNVLSKIGRLGPSLDRGGGMIIPSAIGGAMFASPSMENIALGTGSLIAGIAARKAASVMQKNAAEKAINVILSGRGAQNAAIQRANTLNEAINRGYFGSGLLIPGLLDEERR